MAFTRIFKRNNIADHYEIPDMFKTLIKFMLTNFDDELRYINKEPFFQFYRQFNINMISRKEIKKNAPLIQSTPFDSIPKIFNFDIDLSPSYFELLLFLCGTEKPFQNMHDILNEVIPFYIRYIYYISFQFIHLDETKNDNTSVYNMSLFIDTIKKLIWLFFANQHDYFDECISAFSYLSFELCNLLKNNKNMKIKYKDFLLALPYVAEPLIAFLSNTYTQNINISPLIYFLSSMFSFIFEQNLANDQTMAIVFTYLCLFSKVPNIRMILDEESYISSYVFFIYLMGRENSSQIGIKQYVFVSLQNLLPLRVFRDNYKSMLSYEPLCSSIFQYIWQIVCHVNSNIEITLPKTDEKVEHSPAEYTGDISKLLISDFFTTNTPNKFSKKLPKFEMNIKFAKDITCMSFLSNVILFIKSDINFLYSLFSVFEQKQSCCDNPLHRMFMAFLLKELPSQMVLEFMNKGRLKALFNSKTINIIKYAQDPNLWMLFDSSVATFDLIHSLMNANNSIELKMTIAHLIQHIIRKNEYGSTSSILYFLSNIFKDISKDFGTILFNNDFIYALIFTDLVLIKELIVKRNDDLCFVHLCILKFFSLFLTRKISNIQMFYENVLGVPYYWTIIFDESTQNIGTKCMSQSYDVKGASKIVVESINTYFIDILKHNRVNIKIANLFQKFLNSMIQTIKSSTENFIETLQSTKFLATSSKVCAEIVQIFGNSKEYSTNNPTVDIIYSTLNFYSIISRVAILSPFETPEMEENLLDFISLQKFFQINESIVDILISFSMGAELKISDEFYHIQIKNTSALSILISWCEGTRYLLDVFTMIQQLIKFSVANRYLLFKGNIVSLLLHNITETTNIIVMDILTDIFSFYFQKTELNELFNTLIKSSATIQLSLFQMIKTCICHDNTGTPSAFFHISQKNHNHHFTINGFHFDYPINISFFARFESCKDSTLIIISNSEELLKIQMRNSAMIIKTETEILHLFDSIPILGWQKVILSINNNAITISICGIGSSYMNNQDFKMTNMVVLKKTLFESNNKLTISDCDLDFDEFIIENLGYFSAKMVQNQRCINKYQSKVKANFFGIIIPYSLTINEVIAASGGILIMLPLFSIIPKNSYEHFSIVIDLLIHVLDNQKYHSYQPNLIRSLCAIFKKFDFSLSPKSISNKILNLTQILSSIEIDQYKRELEQYFFSDFELTSKFPGILPQSYIENPKLLNETLSLKEIFIHISLLKDENKIQYLPLLQSYVKQDFLKEEMGTFYYFSLVPDMVELTMTFLINNWGKIPHFNFAKIFSSESTKILLWGIKALSILVSKGLEEELLEQYILSIPAVWNNIQRPDFFLETLLSYLFHTSSDEMHEKLSFTFNFLEIYPFHNIQLLPIFCHVLPNSTISKQAVEYIFARLEQNTGEEIFKAPIWFTCLSYMSTFLEKNNNNFLKILGRIVASNPIKLFEPTIVHSFIICQICGTSFEQVVWQLSNVILSLPNESVISYDFILSLLLCLPKYSIKIEKPADFLSFVNESLLFSIDKIEYNPIIQENTHGLSEVLIHLFLLLLQALYKFHNNFLENAFSPFDNLGEAVAAILYYSPEEKVLEYLFSIDISMPEYMKRIMKCRDKIDRDSINHIDISTIELIVKHSDQFITTFSKWFKSEAASWQESLRPLFVSMVSRVSDAEESNEIDQIISDYNRMLLHHDKIWNHTMDSIQNLPNSVWSKGSQRELHYKLDSTFDGIGRHSRLKRNKNFTNHIDASILRDKGIRVSDSLVARIDYLDVINSYSNSISCKKYMCKLVTIDIIYIGSLYILNSTIVIESNQARNVVSGDEVCKQKICNIQMHNIKIILWRRYHHLPSGIEIFMNSGKSYLINFDGSANRWAVLKVLENYKTKYNFIIQNKPPAEFMVQTSKTKEWRHGEISNYEYLFWVNMISGRSFHDISQYPIFPWILKDYGSLSLDLNDPNIYRDLTKPVGALNESRLESLIERRNELYDGPDKCLYRTHYSAPSFIMYYLVRVEPFTSMHIELQKGRFDNPNRLFRSIEDSWKIVNIFEQNDFRELIPEFFSLPDFLINFENFDLGVSAITEEKINDVELPNWASNANQFIYLHRLALESPYVSSTIHEWIDLIFGFKTRGRAAIDAHNDYHHFTYFESIREPGAVVPDIQDYAVNFGITPEQAFTAPHPQKIINKAIKSLACCSIEFNNIRTFNELDMPIKIEFYDNTLYSFHFPNVINRYKINSITSPSKKVVSEVNRILKYQNIVHEMKAEKSVNFIEKLFVPLIKEKKIVLSAPWLSMFRVTDFKNNDFDDYTTGTAQISALAVDLPLVIVTGSIDSIVQVWDSVDDMHPHYLPGHNDAVLNISVSKNLDLIVSVDSNKLVIFSSLNQLRPFKLFTVNVLPKKIWISNLGIIIFIYDSFNQNNAAIELYDLSGRLIKNFPLKANISTSCLCKFPDYSEFLFICCDKNAMLFRIYDFKVVTIKRLPSNYIYSAFNPDTGDIVLCGKMINSMILSIVPS